MGPVQVAKFRPIKTCMGWVMGGYWYISFCK